MFLSAKAKEKAEKNKLQLASEPLMMSVKPKEEVEEDKNIGEEKPEEIIKEKGKPGRKPSK